MKKWIFILLVSMFIIATEQAYAGNGDLVVNGNINDSGNLSVSGNTGIGTSTPTQKLDVNGNINGSGNLTVSGNTGIGTSTPTQQLDVNGNINGSGNLTVSGNVGIGTATPQAKLDVNGDIAKQGTVIHGVVAGGTCLTGKVNFWDGYTYNYGGATCSGGSVNVLNCPSGTTKWIIMKMTNNGAGGEGGICIK